MHVAAQLRSLNTGLCRLTMIGLGRPGGIRLWLGKHGFSLALCATVLLGGALRVYALDYQSLWTDEIFSLIITDPTLTFREFWDRLLADTHPPIYYLLLRRSSSIFGQSELAARGPSAVFGVLTLCAAAILPGLSMSRSARLAFPLLIAASPGAAWYDREARSYALLLLLSTVITVACLRLLRSRPDEDRKARGAIVMLTVAAVLASFTHYFGFFLAMAGFSTSFLLTERRRKATVCVAACGVIAMVVPWVLYHSQFIDERLAGWIGRFSIMASAAWFEYLSFGGTASLALFLGTAAVLLATGCWRRLAEWNSPIWACVLLCLLTLAAVAMISLHVAILTSRNMIVVLPALYVIAAELTACLVRRWGAAAGAMYMAAQVGLMGQPIAAYYTKEMKEQWRDSAALVMNTPGCESGAIHVYGDASNYRFFTKSVRPRLRLIEIPEGASEDLRDEPVTSCPILVWVVGWAWNADDLRVRLGLSDSSFGVADFYEAFVVFRNPPYT
jgi:mannosyltransferase